MNFDNIHQQCQSLHNRITAAIEHDTPETFAFTVGVQLGALRSRIRRSLNSYVDFSQKERSFLGGMDDCCFDIETIMIDAMALNRELTQMRDKLELARQKAHTMINLALEMKK